MYKVVYNFRVDYKWEFHVLSRFVCVCVMPNFF